ncbi:H-NS histone family protein [Burkholderia territorii]|uniref:H-NS histone family protein n=1 Tax=Burkholderia territorii TaxID=1503055 RepID=UPI0009BD599F|nr:H-NS histone family protein [Burkholderia territorii]
MTGKKRSYSEVKAQIDALQAEAEALRAEELQAVIADIRTKVAEYGITEQDIFGRKRSAKGHNTAPSVPKYRDPKTGATWSGKGRAPSWIANTRNRDRFLIDAS